MIAADSRSDQLQTARNYYLEAAKLGDSNAFVFLGQDPHDPDSLRKAAELGSSQALKILARTSASIEVETKTLEKGKNEYEAAIAHFVRETNRLHEGKFKQN